MEKVLYAIPTMKCNLSCDHCFIATDEEVFNRRKFLDTLNNFDGEIILFGGEPTSNKDRMLDVITSNNEEGKSKIRSVSTNLTILDDELLQYYKKLNHVATSWNPHRFNNKDIYHTWLDNCHKLMQNNIPYIIMITMTEDLLNMNMKFLMEYIKSWEINSPSEIKFEHYVGDVTEDYFRLVDKWLCEIYKNWNTDIKLEIKDRVCNWNFDCDDIYTLYPDGTLINRCPHNLPSKIPSKCYSCERASLCRPCRLLEYCSFPKEFSKLISEEENDVSILSS